MIRPGRTRAPHDVAQVIAAMLGVGGIVVGSNFPVIAGDARPLIDGVAAACPRGADVTWRVAENTAGPARFG